MRQSNRSLVSVRSTSFEACRARFAGAAHAMPARTRPAQGTPDRRCARDSADELPLRLADSMAANVVALHREVPNAAAEHALAGAGAAEDIGAPIEAALARLRAGRALSKAARHEQESSSASLPSAAHLATPPPLSTSYTPRRARGASEPVPAAAGSRALTRWTQRDREIALLDVDAAPTARSPTDSSAARRQSRHLPTSSTSSTSPRAWNSPAHWNERSGVRPRRERGVAHAAGQLLRDRPCAEERSSRGQESRLRDRSRVCLVVPTRVMEYSGWACLAPRPPRVWVEVVRDASDGRRARGALCRSTA